MKRLTIIHTIYSIYYTDYPASLNSPPLENRKYVHNLLASGGLVVCLQRMFGTRSRDHGSTNPSSDLAIL